MNTTWRTRIMRPTDKNLSEMLREAAKMVDRLSHKDIRKSFYEKNYAENTLRAAADALEGEVNEKS